MSPVFYTGGMQISVWVAYHELCHRCVTDILKRLTKCSHNMKFVHTYFCEIFPVSNVHKVPVTQVCTSYEIP